MIEIRLSPQGVDTVQIISNSDAFEAMDLAVLPIVSEYLEKLDRRLRRMAKAAETLAVSKNKRARLRRAPRKGNGNDQFIFHPD
jgi:hypothetical protein